MGGAQRQVKEVRQARMRYCWLSTQHSKNIVSENETRDSNMNGTLVTCSILNFKMTTLAAMQRIHWRIETRRW